MSFLTIPTQEGLFATIKTGTSAEEAKTRSPMDNKENNTDDEEEDEDTEDVRFIPRCSPVPRKRGQSINDETAEYMRIHLALSGEKRVSFADTTGGDLLDVKEFFAFDSDEEEDTKKWEEEELKYRKPERELTYHVHPEFNAPVGSALLQAVHANKVEVEQMSPVDNEPLTFTGVVRVLNISFHKAVYIRATMDNWATYFDHPAEYVQGSHDGDTDQFSFKLSFAPPYTTHGSSIEFVIRYETSVGDFWANNSSMNYVVTLLVSSEDISAQTNIDMQQIKGILKPPKAYSMDDVFDSEDEQENEEEEAGTSRSGLIRPPPVPHPDIIQPEIDVEIAVHPSGPSVPPNQEFPSVDGTLSTQTVSPGEHVPCMSPETTLQTKSSLVLCASEPVQSKSQPLPRLLCELGNQTSEQPIDSSLSAMLPSLPQESSLKSDDSLAGGEQIPSSEGSCIHLPTTEMDLWPSGEEKSSCSCLELPTECVSAPSAAQGTEPEAAVGLCEVAAGLSEGFTRFAQHHEGSMPGLLSPVAESQAFLGEESEARSPELTESASVVSGVTEETQNQAESQAFLGEESEARSPELTESASVVSGVTEETQNQAESQAFLGEESEARSPELTESASVVSGVTEETQNQAESQAFLGEESEARSPELTESASVVSGVTEETQNQAESQAFLGEESEARSPELTESASVVSGVTEETQNQAESQAFLGEESEARSPELTESASVVSGVTEETQNQAESQAFLGEDGEAPLSLELTEAFSVSSGFIEETQNQEESQAFLGEAGEVPPSPEITEKILGSAGVIEQTRNLALHSVSTQEDKEDAPQISPDTLENLPDTSSDISEPQPEHSITRSLMPSIIFLSGVVSLSIVMQEPSTLFFIGLLLVLHRL
uniref:protein phosphatase 1 regulatory subunit 3A isoform X2 n=1 Tax=Monopterus albus TaxID=43700 RepID=UPI0009B37A49|nr:protein phosphatase 1 regulatory subunit 3A-like isoform X2 [Monopterus albus]